MDDERVVEEIVSKFLLNTCRLRPQLSWPVMQAAVQCVNKAATECNLIDEAGAHYIPLTTGSAAEFYIEPMLPHVGDVDVMFHHSTKLAIPQGQSPPTQLPAEFHNSVNVHEIIDSHLPGYVYLKLRYLLAECIDGEGKYNASEYDGQWYMSNLQLCADEMRIDIHGPAVTTEVGLRDGPVLSHDAVICVRCLWWPSQAADWPIRPRNYGWPDSATVDGVVNSGCDVVGVAHRQCRHQLLGRCQWRLSYSRAEIVLLNNWMPVQQIIYHMLRVFMKVQQLTDSADSFGGGKLSNYHIKTLMLWAAELKPKSWWTDDLNLVRICVELLRSLAVSLTEARCPHYFINNCNLVDNSFNLEMIATQLMSTSRSWLARWFVSDYIRKCSQLCPRNVSQWFDDVSTTVQLQDAVSAIVDWRINTTLSDSWSVFQAAQVCIMAAVCNRSLNVWSLNWWLTEIPKISSRLTVYFIAVAFLHIAYKISRNGFSDELMDVLAAIVGQFVGLRRHSNQRSSSLLLSTAAKLIKVIANSSRSTLQLIEIELSKAYLYRALRCTDTDSDSIYCLANVYLAVLFYATGQYQTAIHHCTMVTRLRDHSMFISHVVQGELLPKIDDDIDVVLGLAVFYQYVQTAALNQQQTQHVTVFTTELFAHYLHIKCLSGMKYQRLSGIGQSQSSTYVVPVQYNISQMQQLYISDVLLWKSTNDFSVDMLLYNQQFRTRLTEINTADLTDLLQQSAVEHLTTFRHLEARDFGSVVTIVTTDFEAVYAYKRGDYQRCLQLSTQNVHTLLYADCLASVLTFPEFIQLLDDDIVSLIGLTLIANPECIANTVNCCITQLTLSLYLMTQCHLKLRHSVTSLAKASKYVKVAHRRIPPDRTLNHLTLKLIARCVLRYLRNSVSSE